MRFAPRLLVVAGLMALVAAACGDDGGTDPGVVTLEGVVVSNPTVALQAGQRQLITALGVGTGIASLSDVTFAYTSAAPAIAVVSSTGTIVGFAAGTAVITVTASKGGVSKSTNVNVTVTGTLPTAFTVVSGAASNDFTPNFAVVQRGGTVTWTMTGRNHNVMFGATAGAPANIPTTANQPVGIPRTFASAGTFDYNCNLHAGMVGTVMVP